MRTIGVRCSSALVAVFVLGFVTPRTIIAQERTRDIEAWAHEQWKIARSAEIPIPEDVLIEYDRISYASVSPAEIRQWESTVQGKPDHPLRQRIDLEKRRLDSNGEIDHWSIVRTKNGWRHSRLSAHAGYTDIGRYNSTMWLLSPSQLVDSDGSANPGGPHDLSNAASTARVDVGYLVYGGLGGGEKIGRSIASISTTDAEHWIISAPAETDGFPRAVYTVSASADLGDFAVEKLEFVDADNKTVSSYVFENWIKSPELGDLPIAMVVKHYRGPRLTNEWRVIRISQLTESESEELIRTPELNRPDPIRGELTVNRVIRDTPTRTTFTRQLADGTTTTAVYEPNSPATVSKLRTLGWVSAVCIIFGVVLYKFFKQAGE